MSTRTTKRTAAGRKRAPRLPKAARAVAQQAAELLWDRGVPPQRLVDEVYAALLLRCLKQAQGNFADAAALFGVSRQSIQQFVASPLRDARWKPYQHNRRRRRAPTP
jgi:hypothetical protein